MAERFSCRFITGDGNCQVSQQPCDIKDQKKFGSLSYLGWKHCPIYLDEEDKFSESFSCPKFRGSHSCKEGTVFGHEICFLSYGNNKNAWEKCPNILQSDLTPSK